MCVGGCACGGGGARHRAVSTHGSEELDELLSVSLHVLDVDLHLTQHLALLPVDLLQLRLDQPRAPCEYRVSTVGNGFSEMLRVAAQESLATP